MRFWRSFGAALDVRPGEGQAAALLFALSFVLGLARPLISTAANAIYLSRLDASSLPYLYIGIAIIVTVEGLAVSALQRRLAFPTFLITVIVINIAALCVAWFLIAVVQASWLGLGLAIWNAVVGVLTGLVFWGLAGRLFDIRQAKRLFGLVGSGDAVAGIIAGASVAWLVSVIGTPNLLLAAASGLAVFLALLIVVLRTQASRIGGPQASGRRGERPRGITQLLRNRYLVLLVALAAAGTFAYNFLDASFLASTRTHFASQSELAGFFGIFYSTLSAANLLSRGISGRILNHLGVTFGLLVVPIGLTIAVTALVAFGNLGGLGFLVFWTVAVTRLLYAVASRAFGDPSRSLLYQPLPRQERLTIQTVVETVVQPSTGGLAGGVLLLFAALAALDAVRLGYALLVVLAAWIVVSWLAGRGYVPMLTAALATRRLERTPLDLSNPAVHAALEKGLWSGVPLEVSYCLNVLEESEPDHLGFFLISLLEHPLAEVRTDVLERLERVKPANAYEAVMGKAKSDTSAAVRSAALRTAVALGETDALDEVAPFLAEADASVRTGAIVGILRYGGIEGVLLAGEHLLRLRDSALPAQRAEAARILGDVGIAEFHRPLRTLLLDSSVDVRIAALASAAKIGHPSVWPAVIEALRTPALCGAATVALIAGGEPALAALQLALSREQTTREERIRVVRIVGRIGGPRAIEALAAQLRVPDQKTRDQVLVSLSACNYRAFGAGAAEVKRSIELEANHGARIVAASLDIGGDTSVETLARALHLELERTQDRLLLLLSFLFDPSAILQARRQLATGSQDKRSFALEVIDNLVSNDLKSVAMPLLDESPLDERLRRLAPRFPQARLPRAARLREIAHWATESTSPWTVACAVYTIAELRLTELTDVIDSAQASLDPLIRETAVFAAARVSFVSEAEQSELAAVNRS